jgi:PelA/Pel-15E family pectate lyase
VVLYQTDSGGWPKNVDMTQPPSAAFLAYDAMDERAATIDNGATHTQLRFLARVISAGATLEHRAAFERGFDYLVRAQYPNGGWPQYFPLRPGYYTHITFNDNAMISVLELLRDASSGRPPFVFVDAERRTRAAEAVSRGTACILKCQIIVNGEKTVWCAQHDEHTFAPAAARSYEHASLSGFESVRIVRFLMAIDSPSPEVIDAVSGAVRWFERAKLTGIRLEHKPAAGSPYGFDRVVVADPAAPPLWARFYEIETNRPIFSGRDAVIHYTLAEIEPERRNGYRWYLDEPRALLEKHYPRWARKNLPPSATANAPTHEGRTPESK